MFKSLSTYKHTKGFTLDELEAWFTSDEAQRFQYNENAEPKLDRFALLPVVDGTQVTYLRAEQFFLVRLVRESRRVPAKLVASELKKEVDIQEESTLRPVNRGDKQAMKDLIVGRLLARALPNRSEAYVLFDEDTQLVYASTSASGFAEASLHLIRCLLGSLSVVPLGQYLSTQYDSGEATGCVMADWVNTSELPEGFDLASKVVMENLLGDSVCRGSKLNMSEDWIRTLAKESHINELELMFKNEFSFVVTCDWNLKSIKWPAEFFEEASMAEEPLERLQTNMILTGNYLSDFFNQWAKACIKPAKEQEVQL